MITTRQEIIDALVEESVQKVIDLLAEGDSWYLASIFSDGFVGFNGYSNEDLKQEYAEKFDTEIEIKEV